MDLGGAELQGVEDAEAGVASKRVSKPTVRLFEDLLLHDIFRWSWVCVMTKLKV